MIHDVAHRMSIMMFQDYAEFQIDKKPADYGMEGSAGWKFLYSLPSESERLRSDLFA